MSVKNTKAQQHVNTRPANCVITFFALLLATTFVCLCPGITCSVEQSPNEIRGVESNASPEPTAGAVKLDNPKSGQTTPARSGADDTNEPRELIEKACAFIEQGKFDEAGQLIRSQKDGELVSQLRDIIEQWQKLEETRRLQQEAAYKEQLAKFERLKAGKPADTNDANGSTSSPQDANEPNSPVVILAAVVRTNEFANEKQKKALLSDPCVLDAIDSAKAEAAELEGKGKWLEAYIRCYSWLSAMEPNNKTYTDYAERLIEKAEVAGSFQDSPCETGKQRFEGVKRKIFERAVDALNFNYVSKIDYREMTVKGVRRSRSLAEVVQTLTSRGREPNALGLGESFADFRPDANSLAKLCSGLAALEEETAGWPEDVGKSNFLSAFEKVLELNLTSARMPEGVLIAHFADASFSALDPYTVIVWPTNVADFEKAMTQEFSGIGIEITKQKGQLTVGSLLPDTPAYNSGLDADDVIESVDGTPTKDMTLPCAVKYITGPPGTKVTLMVRSEGEQQPRQITITRAKITVPTIRGWQRTAEGKWQHIVDEQERIGYVRVTSFTEKTASDLENTLKELEASGIRGLILDLRYNSGGLFESAVEIANKFLNDGLIVITRPRFGTPVYSAAHSKDTHPEYPLVVLINPGSASASEIVAGALADPRQRRAMLVGERTHGKGVVQGITHYPGEGAQLKYTMAHYYLPSGQRVKSQEEAEKEGTKEWGIGPNITVELRSDELRKMLDVQRDNDVLVKAGHDNAVSPVKRHTIEQTLKADPQLTTAILVIKSKLIREQALRQNTGQAQTAAKKAA
jgi:carboxyl-terminal processing protease